MSIESLVFFAVLLFLSLIGLAIRWLNERIRRDIALKDLKDLFLPDDDSREQRDGEAPETTRPAPAKPQRSIQQSRPTISPSPERRTGRRLRLRNRAELRQGVIIMTVLGPCRALEHPDE